MTAALCPKQGADLFTITFRSDDVQQLDTSWNAIVLSMSKIPKDDVLESLYKERIREFAQLKNCTGIV